MICQNCGAEYEADSLRCPYCHSENRKAAERLKKDILKGYDKEAEEMVQSVPKKAVKKWTKYVAIGLGAILVLGAVIALVSVIAAGVSGKADYWKSRKAYAKLEEYYSTEDWSNMRDYLRRKSLYGSKYDKYWQVVDADSRLANFEEEVQEIRKIYAETEFSEAQKENLANSWGESAVKSANALLEMTKEQIEDMAVTGNEKILQRYYDEVRRYLEELGFTPEEIDSLEDAEPDEEMLKERLLELLRAETEEEAR